MPKRFARFHSLVVREGASRVLVDHIVTGRSHDDPQNMET